MPTAGAHAEGGVFGKGQSGDGQTDASPASRDLPSVTMNIGPGLFVAAKTMPTIALGVRYQMPSEHAFVAGGRFILALPEGPDFFVAGADLGYAGTFYRGDVDAGLLVLAQPQVWVGGSDALLYTGAAVGPFVRYGHFEAELLVGGGFGTLLSIRSRVEAATSAASEPDTILAGFAF